MAFPQKPYKLKCTKCGNSKIVNIRRDALRPSDIFAMSTTCSKCECKMERVEMSTLDNFFTNPVFSYLGNTK